MTGDILDRVRAADPLAGRALPDPTHPDAVAMREQVIAGDADVVDLAGRRRRRRVVAAVAVAAVVATAAAVAVTTRRPTDVTGVGCFTEASTDADTAVLTASDANPVDQCRELWEAGDMDPTVTTADRVPPLVACVLESGVVGVFPTMSCDQVRTSASDIVGPHEADDAGTSPSAPSAPEATPTPSTTATSEPGAADTDDPEGLPMPDFQTSDHQLRVALNEIRLQMLDRCLTLEAASDLAADILAEHGFEGWTIEPIFEGHTDQTCAGFFPDAPERTIWFTPEQPAPGQTPGPR